MFYHGMYVLGLYLQQEKVFGSAGCWGRESSRELKVLAASGHPLYPSGTQRETSRTSAQLEDPSTTTKFGHRCPLGK